MQITMFVVGESADDANGSRPFDDQLDARNAAKDLSAAEGATYFVFSVEGVLDFATMAQVAEFPRIDHARSVLSSGDAAIAAHLLDVPVAAVERVAGGRRPASAPRA
jgi:hypothetical protein